MKIILQIPNQEKCMSKIRFLSVMDRMIMTDISKTIFSVLSVLVIIIVSRNFIKVLNMAVDGLISNGAVFEILGLKIIIASVNFIVPAVFLSILMVLGRMYRDQEMSAFASAGVGIGQLYKVVLKVIIPISLCALLMAFYLAPWATNKVEQVIYHEKQTSGIRAISAGRFSQYGQGGLIFYIERMTDDQVMHEVFVQNKRENQVGIITADRAVIRHIEGQLYFVFIEGERTQGQAGSVDFVFESFAEYAMLIENVGGEQHQTRAGIPIEQLWHSPDIMETRELLHRLSIPFSVFLLSMLAIPLAQTQPRGGAYGNIIVAFLIYFSFSNIEKVFESYMTQGGVSLILLFLMPYFLMGLIILILLIRFYSLSWIVLYFKGKIA